MKYLPHEAFTTRHRTEVLVRLNAEKCGLTPGAEMQLKMVQEEKA